jgi:hypothetical protein
MNFGVSNANARKKLISSRPVDMLSEPAFLSYSLSSVLYSGFNNLFCTMAIHLYRFFELITETGTFHIQCEWFYPTELDLDNASTEQDNNTACCHITVTDFLEYYTCTSNVYI